MAQYLLRRVLLIIPTFFIVSVIVFSMIRLIPGDIVDQMLEDRGGIYGIDHEEIRERMGLNRPIYVQYLSWASNFITGDFGSSLWNKRSGLDEFKRRFPVTFQLAVMTIVLASVWGVFVGIVAAVRQDTVFDFLLRTVSVIGLSIPYFWSSTLIIIFASLWFNWSSSVIYVPPFGDRADFWENMKIMIVPATLFAFAIGAPIARMTRATLLEVMRTDYIRTARAKGLTGSAVISRHALKNALIPVVAMIGIQAVFAVGGSTIMETIWRLPGLGQYIVDVVLFRDYTMLQALTMFIAMIIIVINLLVDISYAWLDPRIRYQ